MAKPTTPTTAASVPQPDKHGWYRVRDKTNRRSGSWSSRLYNPATMTIHPGPASDIYGAALPPKAWQETPATNAADDAATPSSNIEGDKNVG